MKNLQAARHRLRDGDVGQIRCILFHIVGDSATQSSRPNPACRSAVSATRPSISRKRGQSLTGMDEAHDYAIVLEVRTPFPDKPFVGSQSAVLLIVMLGDGWTYMLRLALPTE